MDAARVLVSTPFSSFSYLVDFACRHVPPPPSQWIASVKTKSPPVTVYAPSPRRGFPQKVCIRVVCVFTV